MPVSDRFKVSVAEKSDDYSNVNGDGFDGVTDRLLPNSQDVSLQSAMETGLFIRSNKIPRVVSLGSIK